MNESLGLKVIQTTKKLIGKHQYRLKRGLVTSIAKNFLQVRAEKFKHHHAEFAALSVPVNLRYARSR